MKKLFYVLFSVLLSLVPIGQAMSTDIITDIGVIPVNVTISISGYPGPGWKATLTDTAATLQSIVEGAGGTWLGGASGTKSPIGVMLQSETYGTRCFPGGTTPTVDNVGFNLAALASWHIGGSNWVSTLKCVNASAGNNAILQGVLEY